MLSCFSSRFDFRCERHCAVRHGPPIAFACGHPGNGTAAGEGEVKGMGDGTSGPEHRGVREGVEDDTDTDTAKRNRL